MEQEKLELLARKYLDGTATPEEMEELDNWYYSFHPSTLTVEIPAASTTEEKELEKRMRRRLLRKIRPGNRVQKRRYYYAAAAVVLLVITCAVLYNYNNTSKIAVTAATSQQKFVALPDGTKLWLNAESTVAYPHRFASGVREVSLVGEGYFDVAHDAARPFVIHVSDITITVLGTAFNVKAYPGKPVSVTVVRGRVQVQYLHHGTLLIQPNQQVVPGIDKLEKKDVKADLYDSWKEGGIDINDESFEEIGLTLHRRFNINIRFKNEEAKQLRFTAGFDKGTSPEKILDMLSRINKTNWYKAADGVYWVTD